MLYCCIVVPSARFKTGCVSAGLMNCTVPPFSTKREPLRIMSPLERLTRPRITGSAACRDLKIGRAAHTQCAADEVHIAGGIDGEIEGRFWLNPRAGGAAASPENWLMKLVRSKAGVNERSERLTLPPSTAVSGDPVKRMLASILSRIPCG